MFVKYILKKPLPFIRPVREPPPFFIEAKELRRLFHLFTREALCRVAEHQVRVIHRREMFRSPDIYGYLITSGNPWKKLTVSLSGTLTGRMLLEHHAGYIPENRTERTPCFIDLKFKASYDFRIAKGAKLQVNAGVKNFQNSYQKDFDNGPDRDSGDIYGPSAPRSLFVGLKLGW